MTTIGIIDIGTNTILCLKGIIHDGKFDIVFDRRYHYRAGKRFDDVENISLEYKTNLRLALLTAVSSINDCDKIKIVATEIFRRPKDGCMYAEQLSAELGYPIEIIDNQREAELSFKGAISGFGNLSGKIGVIDIGGGSTEIAVGENQKLLSWSGLKIGAVAIREAVGYDCPLDSYLTYAVDTFRHSNFVDILNPSPDKMVIVGGTAVAVAGLTIGLREFEPERLQGWEIDVLSLKHLLEKLAAMDIDNRKKLMAFEPERADIIISGGAIILAFMRFAAIDTLKVSTRGLRYGLLEEIGRQFNA
ncbi:MAG: hypothetical protein GX409_02830 [candidate division Zixibacteria bacterium]|nr:hypothetical protein [candidate division Zixibacteria bacterium]